MQTRHGLLIDHEGRYRQCASHAEEERTNHYSSLFEKSFADAPEDNEPLIMLPMQHVADFFHGLVFNTLRVHFLLTLINHLTLGLWLHVTVNDQV